MPISFLFRPLSFLALTILPVLPAQAESLAGSYLAARQANYDGDFRLVVEYGTRALAQDPDNAGLLEEMLAAQVGLGAFDLAIPSARRLRSMEPENQVASMVLLSEAIGREDWQGTLDILERGDTVGDLMDNLITAWAYLGLGQMSQSLDVFKSLAELPGSERFALYHQAIALALVGDYESAAALLGDETGVAHQLSREGIVAFAQILSQLERAPEAVEMLDQLFPQTTDAELIALRSDLAAGKPLAFDAVTTPRQAIADAYYAIADSLATEVNPNVVLLYSRASEYLDPGRSAAILLSAELLEMLERYELAVEAYSRIPHEDPAYPQAAYGRSEALRSWGKVEEAIGELRILAEAYPDLALVHLALGDTLRFESRYDEAGRAYDAAIKLFKEPTEAQWSVYFFRAVTHEREGRWPQAEADFRKALELSPGQARVLNYLGYSYVEMGENLDEALEMIEQAVINRPNDGYIIDSLGWVYYRLGRYDEAAVQMERAVELMPVDPVVNDHLGDVLWAVGRQLEAEFQWKRALSFITDDTDLEELGPDRIRRKLQVGLDTVLEEEGAPPLTRTNEDG